MFKTILVISSLVLSSVGFGLHKEGNPTPVTQIGTTKVEVINGKKHVLIYVAIPADVSKNDYKTRN